MSVAIISDQEEYARRRGRPAGDMAASRRVHLGLRRSGGTTGRTSRQPFRPSIQASGK